MTKTRGEIAGIGNDIIEIERIRESLSEFGDKFYDRILTPREQEYCKSMNDPVIRLAGRYAAKEAIAKALGTGIGKLLSWLDMEIVNDAAGKPEVLLSPEASIRHGHPLIFITISHERTYATAVAISVIPR